jgi:hypothetical protein
MAAALAVAAPVLAAPPPIRPFPTPPAQRTAPPTVREPLRPFAPPALSAAGTNVLRCRGGAVSLMGLEQVPSGYSTFVVHFTRGTKPADQGLEPTQCAWQDRGMNPDESPVVCQEINQIFLTLTHSADAKYNPPDIYLVDVLYSKTAKWIEKVRSPDEYFEFHVKSEGCQRVVT